MENKQCRVLLLMCLFALFFIYSFTLPVMAEYMKPSILESVKAEDPSSLKTYIVYTRKPEDGVFGQRSSETHNTWYHTFLDDTTTNSNHKSSRIVHMYKSVVNGFAARLTDEEVKALESKEGFLFAHQERVLSLHTTHTPNFLGLHEGLGIWDVSQSNQGKGIIIGLLDTGISPDHPSFSDDGMLPPPAKWKGKCEFGTAVCNKKLIGARNLINAGKNGTLPFDEEGHGTHTASTAAGRSVVGASGFGNAKGTAVGMAPYAHLAIYKVCSEYGCAESDILAAIDTAIEDGVDVLSISIGGSSVPFYKDGTAVGAFAAMQKGIFVSCSAGNDGPKYNSLVNEAPWILTVGASTIDRRIKATTKLGNGKEYDGESLFQPNHFSSVLLPLVYAGSNSYNINSTLCAPGSLKNVDVKGKIVLCERGGDIPRIVKGKEVKNAGGVAMIIMNQKADGFSTLAEAHVLPASHVSYAAGLEIKAYINSTSKPTATILFKGTVIGDSTAPSVSSFSSRGPNLQSPGILKPDIIGPGVNILAAWPFSLDSSTIISKSTFNMISGTSMSCPHLSGIAALLKSSHPNWSPAAIKSAIMTSAYMYNLGGDLIVDQNLSPADIFATGAGHVNPSRANDPGLVYDIGPEDYVSYLCGLNYTDQQVEIIINKKVKCSEVKPISEGELNYPSFSAILGSETQYFTRTVTNVGPANSSYNFDLYVPHKTGMSISPQTLAFTEVNQKATFRVEIIPKYGAVKDDQQFSQGYLRWVSDKHIVTSPISVVFGKVDNE